MNENYRVTGAPVHPLERRRLGSEWSAHCVARSETLRRVILVTEWLRATRKFAG
jgi:hypothetical protein